MAANSAESRNGHDRAHREIADWYAGFTRRESLGKNEHGVDQWGKSELGKVTEAVIAHRKGDVTLVPEFPVQQPDGSEVAVSLKVILHTRPGFSNTKDVSLALVARNPNFRNPEIQPIERVEDLTGARPEVLSRIADGLREVPVARPLRRG